MNPVLFSDMNSHLERVMERERNRHGEFLLASIVQDSLTYSLVSFMGTSPTDEEVMEVVHSAAKLAIQSAMLNVHLNEFVARESVRGTILAVVGLGGDVNASAVPAFLGAAEELLKLGRSAYNHYASSLVEGICDAAGDSGGSADKLRILLRHISAHLPELVDAVVSSGGNPDRGAESI